MSVTCRLFETHPEVQSVFVPFKGKSQEDLADSAQLKSHALRVMGTVEKSLDSIGDLDSLQKTLHELGAKHIMYNAKVDYIDVSPSPGRGFFFFFLAPICSCWCWC